MVYCDERLAWAAALRRRGEESQGDGNGAVSAAAAPVSVRLVQIGSLKGLLCVLYDDCSGR
jgi:hypothetical protein